MYSYKLTALSSILLAFLIGLTACERTAEEKKITEFSKLQIPLTGAQETPATASSALGTMDVHYSKETRILTYTVNWTGLTGPVTAMHIHGTAPIGYAAAPVQNIITSSNGIFRPGSAYGATSKVSATMLIDGVVVTENDLLNGFYYINIHTAAYPNGEIRGQIVFQ